MRCHLINESTYERESYILGCKRMIGRHDYLYIAEIMTNITDNYKIDYSKITHTVTDNASNFGKSFITFSEPIISQSNVNTMDNFNEEDDICSTNSEDFEDSSIDFINLNALLSTPTKLDNDQFSLLPHITCCAHSLNLIATHEISRIIDVKYNKLSESTFKKLSSFWNLLSRSIVASDKVLKICGCKFPVPVVTRWNSLFNASKKFLKHKSKIEKTFDELCLTKLKNK